MSTQFRDTDGQYLPVGVKSPLPTAGGQVLRWLDDDFNTGIDPNNWEVTGTPSVTAGELTVGNGHALLSHQTFSPPCLVEIVETMTARASTDDFRLGFYRDDANLVEWRASGITSTYMDAMMSANGVADNQTAISVGAANNSYRLASIYIGLGEAVWAYRNINSVNVRTEVYRLREHGIPDGPFRIRLAGLAGTSSLKVHRVTAYQLADIMPPGSLGHNVDQMAVPVRVTNGPLVASPTNAGISAVQSTTDTFSALAAGTVGTGSNRAFYQEQSYLQAHFMGDQPFSWWVEAQIDGTNWQVVAYGTSTDATADAVLRYFASSPVLRVLGSRYFRVKVKNNGAAAGTFRGTMVAAVL